MKKIFSLLAFAFLFSAQAEAAQGYISHIVCSGGQLGVGSATITYTGFNSFNITEFNAFGFPFSQQAAIVNVNKWANSISFDLKGLINGITYHLELTDGSNLGVVSSSVGRSMNLVCVGNVNIL